MKIQVSEYTNVKEKALKLGCNVPTGLALLPRNFAIAKSKEELVHENFVPTLRKLLQEKGISETKIEKKEDRFPNVLERGAFEWIGPIIFVSASLLSQNPHIIQITLGVVSNYLTDWFKGIPGNKQVKLDIVVEKTEGKTYKHICYEGDPSGLNELPRIVNEVHNRE